MHEVAPRQLAAYAVLAILIGIAGARYARSALAGAGDAGSGSASAALTSGLGAGDTTVSTSGADAAPADATGAGAAGPVGGGAAAGGAGSAVVDVTGAVRHPGVYRLAAGARIDDALRRAGGPTHHADLEPVNLAAVVTDGQQIVVPRHGQAAALVAAPASPGGAATSASSAGGASPATPIDLNTATADQLDTIDGVGPATAQKILAYRQLHGGFKSVEELMQVSGIGPKKLAAMRAFVRV